MVIAERHWCSLLRMFTLSKSVNPVKVFERLLEIIQQILETNYSTKTPILFKKKDNLNKGNFTRYYIYVHSCSIFIYMNFVMIHSRAMYF